jgi:hypothetical protein
VDLPSIVVAELYRSAFDLLEKAGVGVTPGVDRDQMGSSE